MLDVRPFREDHLNLLLRADWLLRFRLARSKSTSALKMRGQEALDTTNFDWIAPLLLSIFSFECQISLVSNLRSLLLKVDTHGPVQVGSSFRVSIFDRLNKLFYVVKSGKTLLIELWAKPALCCQLAPSIFWQSYYNICTGDELICFQLSLIHVFQLLFAELCKVSV